MDAVNITNARQNLFQLVNDVNDSHQPVQILGKNGNAILISEEDWRAIEETLYLSSVSGMVQSIHDAAAEPASSCTNAKELDW